VIVSTVSSYQGKRELRKLKQFDVAIIDEASQLLEPMLVGLLSRFPKSILIGDHKQLPAVVTQPRHQTKVHDASLMALGIRDRSVSLFERMYRKAVESKWTWAYGRLTHQGRMHTNILEFISPEFYEDSLKVLPGLNRLVDNPNLNSESEFQSFLIENRMIFVDTPVDPTLTRKTNMLEAEMVGALVEEWMQIYSNNNKVLTPESIGVITPFRSQIAMIKTQEVFKGGVEVTIDTVERYQGGSRDQIIISLAINEHNLLGSITNVSHEGVDRKLNVALTRAREHIVILGNKEILERNPCYQRLIDHCVFVTRDDLLKLGRQLES